MPLHQSPHITNYYKGWIYLATLNKADYYVEHLPTPERPQPKTAFVHGIEPYDYTSIRLGIAFESEQRFVDVVSFYAKLGAYYAAHMLMLIRERMTTNAEQ